MSFIDRNYFIIVFRKFFSKKLIERFFLIFVQKVIDIFRKKNIEKCEKMGTNNILEVVKN